MMTEVCHTAIASVCSCYLCLFQISHYCIPLQVYANVSGEPALEEPVIDVSAQQFYGEGYDDSDKRIPDMTLINKQLGIILCNCLFLLLRRL